jgi:hypothetical protein CLOSPO_02893
MARKALEPNLWTIGDTFKHMYFVPVYQRPYSWETTQINVILDDIFDAYRLPEAEREEGYFIGSIYIHDRNEKLKGLIQKYEIIDGQQRLTTIALLLLSIYSHAIQYDVTENDQTLLAVKSALWKYVDRSYDKQNRAVTLNSIEKKSFEDLYNSCFDKPKDILSFCKLYNPQNRFEKRVIENFMNIYTRVGKEFPADKESNDLLNFADFLLNFVQIIAIDSTCSISKAFSIFESINSKGKPLDEIDKIKTYIFSELDEDSYDFYLDLWGKLVIETHDQLYDYLYNYIKAYISFYRQNINVDNFKSLSKNEIQAYFKKNDIAEALKALLDDMYKNVKYYNMLGSVDKANELVKNNEFRFYYTIFNQINYKHPKPLFLRCIEEYASGKMSKTDLVCVIRETVKFMFEFLTISDRDSKDAITMFSSIMNDIYIRGNVDKDVVVNVIANEMISKAVTTDRIKSDLANMDAYDQNKKIAVALLSLYESTSTDEDGKVKISYDKAYTLLNDYGQTFSLDHLLVQSPAQDSDFKYYRDDNDKLVLKDGHDFEPGVVVSGMEYDQFTRIVLNKIGNLRLWYKDDNSSRQNDALQLNEYSGFITYAKIKERGETIIDDLMVKCLPMLSYNPKLKLTSDLKENALPKMNKLIEYGLLHPGDKLYITLNPTDSEATLIDGSYVDYKGVKTKINDWGCKITGWKSVNIYTISALVGEDETLQQKRVKYTINHNEETLG